MKKGLITLLMLAAVLATFPLRADVLVLVHGYLSGSVPEPMWQVLPASS